jgi:plastocyanin
MDRRAFLRGAGAAGSVLSVGALSGCFGVGAEPDTEYDVGMSTRDFRPEVIEVTPGEPVVWRNTSSHAHTVTAYENALPAGAPYWASGDFASEDDARRAWRNGGGGALYQDERYQRTFEVAGEHHYVCIPHEQAGMVGAVVVEE